MGNIVAIVGRPNVGKSTLFNRLTESRSAIVQETSGVTRDRHYGKAEWNGVEFSVIDTGGYVHGSDDIFEAEIRKQAEIAMDEASVIVCVVDVTVGITDLDEAVTKFLRRTDKPIFLVSNKVDNSVRDLDSAEFYSLGMGEVYSISAINGSGTGELLDAVVGAFNPELEVEDLTDVPRISIIGKPNVGKSSLCNALLGEDRNIVTDISGTTRDAINTRYKAFGFDFVLVDTAGIRKKAKIDEDIEFYSTLRSVRTIENSDVCVLMVDAEEGVQKQDLHIFYMAENNHKGVVILVNKWDLIEKETNSMRDMEEDIRSKIAPFTDVPIVFTSALTKQRIHKALETAIEVYHNRTQRISTSELNRWLETTLAKKSPPAVKGKFIKVKYVTQLPTHAPSFAFFANLPQYIRDDYKRFLENRLRDDFNFEGVPVRIYFRKK